MPYDPDLIMNNDNHGDVTRYLIGCGYHAAELSVMNNVQLINLYHKEGWTRTPLADDIQRATSRAVADTLASIVGTPISDEAIRQIVRDELAALAPRRIEVVSARGTVILDGPTHYRTSRVIQIASLGHPIMMVGPAGCGKTTIGEHVAKALQLPFQITNTINDTHELTGFIDGHGKYHSTPFRKAFEHGGVWIADEIDAWDASALLAANSALANGFASFPDAEQPVRRHNDFRMVATANTFGSGADRVYVGRNELDAASLDRFSFIKVDYDLDLERLFAGSNDLWLDRVWEVRKAVTANKIRHVVSSRAISFGAAALSIGIEWDDVNDMYLFKGMSQKDRSKIDA